MIATYNTGQYSYINYRTQDLNNSGPTPAKVLNPVPTTRINPCGKNTYPVKFYKGLKQDKHFLKLKCNKGGDGTQHVPKTIP